MMRLTWIIPLAFTFARSMAQDLAVGSSCSLRDGRPGVCKRIKDCEQALHELLQKKDPTTCSFDHFQPVVCCPQPVGSISARKCEEYSRHVYVEEISSWLPGASKINKSRCAAIAAGTPLLIGGEKAKPREFPHMALIGYGDREHISWGCGGSLISESYVLTAAHCTKLAVRWVLLGDLVLNKSDDDARPQLIGVSSVKLGPGFSPGHRYNDIALLRLEREAELNEYVRPACLHVSRNIPVDAGLASGWGRTSNYNESMSDTLMKVAIPFRRKEECQEVYREERNKHNNVTGFDDETMLCIGNPKKPKDTCKGDSGGPFQTVLDEPFCMYDILGVTSFGRSHCGTSTPAVYTRVSKFVPWIESVVWPTE
ncbi:venom protease [Anabrus simplex]|uniref:venom protease n=1 Tax=Anabrus simplex TaxID=316456 RepID=UPI0035A2CE51